MNYIGGYFISGEDLGKDLALLTHCVLTKGFENSPAFQFTPSLPNYYINYPTFVASGIDPSLLPENTVFYNEEPSLWQEHPGRSDPVCLFGYFDGGYFYWYLKLQETKGRRLQDGKYQNDGTLEPDAGHGDHL